MRVIYHLKLVVSFHFSKSLVTTTDTAAAGSLTLCCALLYLEEARMHAKATLEALWWQTNKTMDKIMNLSVKDFFEKMPFKANAI